MPNILLLYHRLSQKAIVLSDAAERRLPTHTTDSEAVVLISTIQREQIARIEAQAVRARATDAYGRPIVADGPATVKRP